jgi:predicted NAD-dependent protein-ADP-ribosyltransferase YbiA (DUF1768 family)
MDGVDHINVYSKGKTELGRMLSNFYPSPFTLRGIQFKSVETFWYYIIACNMGAGDELKGDVLAKSGWEVKEFWKQYKTLANHYEAADPTRPQLKLAYLQKLKENPAIQEKLIESTLPLRHYYQYGYKIVPTKHGWTVELWEEIREELKNPG